MIEKVMPDIYRIEVPLPNNPLGVVNSYVVKGGSRPLIIDTAMNREECLAALSSGLSELGVDPAESDFFITHCHVDHYGLVDALAGAASSVYLGREDAIHLNSGDVGWEKIVDIARYYGFPEEEIKRAVENHPGIKYGMTHNPDFHMVTEDDAIDAGDYRFRCIETPGHTMGHTCLYEPEKKLLISGDHILMDITPNITLWHRDHNPLEEYLASLDKVYGLDVELLLPGHRGAITDLKGRIRELKQHHRERGDEVISILGSGEQSAWQVASQMSWDIVCGCWEELPSIQKWFAANETVTHLKYLYESGEVRCDGDMFSLR